MSKHAVVSNSENPRIRYETMTAFLSLLREKYGGVKEYAKNYLGLSEDDIDIIQENLIVSSTLP
jgi:hypothetical protein